MKINKNIAGIHNINIYGTVYNKIDINDPTSIINQSEYVTFTTVDSNNGIMLSGNNKDILILAGGLYSISYSIFTDVNSNDT